MIILIKVIATGMQSVQFDAFAIPSYGARFCGVVKGKGIWIGGQVTWT